MVTNMLMKVQGCRKGKKRVFSLQSFVPVIKLQVLSYSLSHSPSCSPLMPSDAAAAGTANNGRAASFAADAPLDAETRGRSRKAEGRPGEKARLLPVQTFLKMALYWGCCVPSLIISVPALYGPCSKMPGSENPDLLLFSVPWEW